MQLNTEASTCRVGIFLGVFLVTAVAFSGCASTNHSVPTAYVMKIGNIGVVSLLSDEFHLIHIGTTVFETRKQVDSVPQWKIDEFVTSLLKTRLSQNSRYRVGVLEKGEIIFPFAPGNEFDFNLLAESASKHGFDTVVVVRPDNNAKTAHLEGGYGLYHMRKYPVPGLHRCIYSLFLVEVIDIKRMDTLGTEQVQFCDGDIDIEFNSRLADYSEAERTLIERMLKKDLTRGLMRAIRKLGLI